MEFELRSILLVIGVVVIAAILIHGLIGIRKANKPVDLSGIDLKEEDADGNIIRDDAGFDRHGVGVARVVNAKDEPVNDSDDNKSMPTIPMDDGQLDLDIPNLSSFDVEDKQTNIDFDVALVPPMSSAFNENTLNELDDNESDSPLFDSPIYREKPSKEREYQSAKTEEQPQLDPGGGEEFEQPNIAQTSECPEPQDNLTVAENDVGESAPLEPMDVLVLNVVGSDGDELNGAQLLPILLTLGFKFGEMDIFHRHADSAGNGEVLFSLANMVKPGVFDLDNMEQFLTTGVSLFMTLPHRNGNLETFNLMLNAAAKIAEEFSGQVLDGNRSTLTKQSTQHYVERIREVERKLLLTK